MTGQFGCCTVSASSLCRTPEALQLQQPAVNTQLHINSSIYSMILNEYHNNRQRVNLFPDYTSHSYHQ